MPRNKVLLLMAISSFSLLLGCRKMDVPTDTPKCVLDRLPSLKQRACPHNASLSEYLFQGKAVYVFNEGNCIADGASEVMNEQCETLGYLGGFAGNSIINGANFYKTATLLEVIWAN